MASARKRLLWIDCAKAIAILAVVVDHFGTFGLASDPHFLFSSYFAVALFVMLSGFSLGLKHERTPVTFLHQLRKVGLLFVQYAVCVAVYTVWLDDGFAFDQFFDYLLHFSAAPPHFFLLFFCQLELIAPLLLRLPGCKGVSCGKSFSVHLLYLVLMAVVSALCIRYTNVMDVYGAGQFLFGGTYLFLFFLGMFLSRFLQMPKTNWPLWIVLVLSGAGWFAWREGMISGLLQLDQLVANWFGAGFDPPSIHFSVFALLTFFLCFSFFSLLERSPLRCVSSGLAVYGRYTLYVYLYHWLILEYIQAYYYDQFIPDFPYSLLIYAAAALIPFLLGAVLRNGLRLIQKYIRKH